MFKSKGHVGRPSNEEIRARKIKKSLVILLPLIIVVIGVIVISNGSLGNLMGNSVTEYYCADSSYTLKGTDCVKTITVEPNLLGDANKDGDISIIDATQIQKSIISGNTDDIAYVADVNKDGLVNETDANLIQQYLVGNLNNLSSINVHVDGIGSDLVCPEGFNMGNNKCTKEDKVKALVKEKVSKESPEKSENGQNIVYGDVNLDGKIDGTDLEYLTKYLAHWSGYDLTEQGIKNADLNVDGKVNSKDRMILTRHLDHWSEYGNLPYKSQIEESDLLNNAVYGDVNVDGKVDGTDLEYLTRYLAHWSGYDLTEQGNMNADINTDGKVDAKDRMTLSRYFEKSSEVKTFKLKYNANGGTGKMNDQDITFGVNTKLNENKFTKKNAAFNGWRAYNNNKKQWACYKSSDKKSQGYTDKANCKKYGYVIYKDGQNVAYTGNPGENITMYAQWKNSTDTSNSSGSKNTSKNKTTPSTIKNNVTNDNNTFTIVYNSNGGTGSMQNQNIVYGVKTKLSKNTFTKKDSSFAGWHAYNNNQKKWACYKNSNHTSQGYTDNNTCSKYGYVVYKNENTVSRTGKIGETVVMYAQWKNSTDTSDPSGSKNTGKNKKTTYDCSKYGNSSEVIRHNKNQCYKIKKVDAKYEVIKGCKKGYVKVKSGQSDSTAYCVKKIDANKTVANTYCPSGYSKVNGGTGCQKIISVTESSKCPSGYKLKNGQCTKKVSATKYAANTYCPSGYSKVNGGTSCQKNVSATSTSKCSSGYKLKNGKCTKKVSATKYAANTYCPSGYSKVNGGTSCQKSYPASKIPGTSQYKCSNGGRLSGKKCIITKGLKTEYGYRCSNGTKSGSGANTKCTITKKPTTKYSCSKGRLSGKKCILTTSLKTEYGYRCANGTKSGSGANTKCTITSKPTIKYSCSKGNLSGKKCILTTSLKTEYGYRCANGTKSGSGANTKCTITSKPTVQYSCSKGNLSGNQCILTTDLKTEYHYSCSSGKLSGTECILDTTSVNDQKRYYCDTGKLSGTKCLTPGKYLGLATSVTS